MSAEIRYVSCVPGKLVTRFGTDTFIGASFDPKTQQVVFDEEEIVAIPVSEWTSFTREYNRLLKAGDLKPRTQADYDARTKKQADAANAEAKEAKAKALKSEAEAKERAEQ